MQKIAISRDGICLSQKYIKNQIKLIWQCEFNHIWEATPNHIKNGTWCPFCCGNKKLTIEKMNEIAKLKGGICLSNIYIDAHSKLEWQCSLNHIWPATPDSINNADSWCPACSKNKKLDIGEMNEIAAARNGRCLSEYYINAKSKLTWQCNIGHIWDAIPDAIKFGTWCPHCIIYFNQEFCRLYLSKLFNAEFLKIRPAWLKNPKTGWNLELDGYCSELKLAFEYNGRQHYEAISFCSSLTQEQINDNFEQQKERDKLKIKLCKENGVKLIVIPYWENKIKYIRNEYAKLGVQIINDIISVKEIENIIYNKQTNESVL